MTFKPGDRVIHTMNYVGGTMQSPVRRTTTAEATIIWVKEKSAKILFTERNIEKVCALTSLRKK